MNELEIAKLREQNLTLQMCIDQGQRIYMSELEVLRQRINFLENPPTKVIGANYLEESPKDCATIMISKNETIRETIASGYIHDIGIVLIPDGKEIIIIKVKNQKDPTRTNEVYLEKHHLEAKDLIKQLRIQGGISFTAKYRDSKLGEMFLDLLAARINNASILVHNEYPGWNALIKGEKYEYLSAKNSMVPNLPISKKKLCKPMKNTVNKIILNYLESYDETFMDASVKHIMLSFAVYSAFWTIFKDKNIVLTTILVARNADLGFKVLQYFLRVFDGNLNEFGEFILSNQVWQLINESKDETVILKDKQCEDAKEKQHCQKVKSSLIDGFVNGMTMRAEKKGIKVNASLALASDSIMYEFPAENFIILDFNETVNTESIESILRSPDIITENAYSLIKYYEGNIDQCINTINKFQKYYEQSLKYEFEYANTAKCLAVLMTAFELYYKFAVANQINFNLTIEEVQCMIAKYLKDNEMYSETEGITLLFKERIIDMANEGKINRIYQIKGAITDKIVEGLPTFYIDKKFIYLSLEDLNCYIIPSLLLRVTSKQLLKAIQQDGFLYTYNTKKESFEVKPILYNQYGVPERKNMIKISKSLFNELGDSPVF